MHAHPAPQPLSHAHATPTPPQDRLAALERQRLVVDAQQRKVERRAARARSKFTQEAEARAGAEGGSC
jgi:hypothetical protein